MNGEEHQAGTRERYVQIPRGIQTAAAWSWRLLLIVGAAGLTLWLLSRVILVVIPVVVALLLSALLQPIVAWLQRRGLRRGLATAIVFVGTIVALAGVITAIIVQLANNLTDVRNQAADGINEIRDWLRDGPLGISDDELDQYTESLVEAVRSNQDGFSRALEAAITVAEFVTGTVLGLFTLFFFLFDGERIWRWVTQLFPRAARSRINDVGKLAWHTLVGFVRATVIVAFFDALFIGIALFIFDVPLTLPLAMLVFLGAFVPIVGAFVTGAVAVLVALVTKGLLIAILILIAVVAVQQIESHAFQPFIVGRLVSVHPLGVVLAIATGALIGGIFGALIAVPFAAVTNTVVRALASGAMPSSGSTVAGPGGDITGKP